MLYIFIYFIRYNLINAFNNDFLTSMLRNICLLEQESCRSKQDGMNESKNSGSDGESVNPSLN